MITYIKNNLKNIILYVTLALIVCFLLMRKVDFHVDELLTYNLANAENWFEPESGVIFSPASQPFIDAMSSNGIFDLKHVWNQQTYDTHPPFYYLLVHAVCTLFPGTVSIKYAGIINIIFLLLTFYFYKKIVKLLIDDQTTTYILSVMFILSAGILSIATFLRMYVMAMFWVTVFAYIILRNLEHFTVKNYIHLAAVAICGALTHYYFIVYAFFISLIAIIIMVCEKRFREIVYYIISMVGASGVACLIFPAMIRHIFKTGRGAQSIENMTSSDLVTQFKAYFEILNNNVFGGLLGLIISIIFFFLLINFIKFDNDEVLLCKIEKVTAFRYICLLIPAFCYLLLISKSAPYNTDRYLSPIYAVTIAGLMCLLYTCFASILTKRKNVVSIFTVVVAIIASLGLSNCSWDYLNKNNEEHITNAEIYGESADAICLYDEPWKINPYFLEISSCSTSTFYNITNYEEFKENVNIENLGDKLAFFLIGMDADSFISSFVAEFPEYSIVKDDGAFAYGKSFYLERNKLE